MDLMYAMGIGFLLDCILGDPRSLPHPIRWIGGLILALERFLYPKEKKRQYKKELFCGILLVLSVLFLTGGAVVLLRYAAYGFSRMAGVLLDGILFFYCIAPRSLCRESMAVCQALLTGDGAEGSLFEARTCLSRIVGRDTKKLTKEGIIRAAVETVAENTSDGVTAPMFYMALGGPVLCFLYKAVNTMDSMVGYHNDTYEYFGRAAARTDDLWNYIPSRLTAYLMLLAAAAGQIVSFFSRTGCERAGAKKRVVCFFVKKNKKTENSYNFKGRNCSNNSHNSKTKFEKIIKKYPKTDIKRALSIYRRDRRKHKSPNSAQTESVCAGVLGIQLAGDASYFGRVVHKPVIGDDLRVPVPEDILRANKLMYGTAVATLLLLMVCRGIVYCWGVWL